MKICYVFDLAYPFSIGGAEKRIYNYANIAKGTFQIEIICMKLWKGKRVLNRQGLSYVGVIETAHLYNKEGKRKIIPAFLFGLAVFFRIIKSKPHIIDVEIFPYFPLIFIYFAKLFLKRKPVVIGYWSEYLGKKHWQSYAPVFWPAGYILEYLCSKICDRNVANSAFTKRRMMKHLQISSESLPVIPPSWIDWKKPDLKVVEKKYDVVYFGRLIQHKSVDTILKILKILETKERCRTALIVGNGPQEKRLKRMAVELGLSGCVHFTDHTESYDELITRIKSARVMVFPSQREGFGISVIEANACGLPVIVIDYPSNASKDLIANGSNGFVCVDEEDAAEKLNSLLEDSAMLMRMSEGSLAASECYNFDKIETQVMNLYGSM